MATDSPIKASEADITDELEKGGPALGAFMKATGLAIAEAQDALDKTFRETAKMLSEAQIDVIAVFEQVVDDDGSLKEGIVKKQKLPLINYIMPVGYAFKRVYIEADMKVQEFNAANGMNIKGQSTSVNVGANFQASVFGASGGGSFSLGHSNFSQDVATSTSTDNAAGSLHLEASLEPRQDIVLPSPIILQKGPKLSVRMTSKNDVLGADPGSGAPIPVVGRQANVEIVLKKTDGSANSGKDVSINVSDPLVQMVTNSTTTDANGKISLTLKREWGQLAAGTAAPAPSEVAVRVTFGIVTDSTSVLI